MTETARKHVGNIAGWYGTFAFLAAYVLVSFSVIQADRLPYQLLNLSGALAFVALGATQGVRQIVTLNAVWSAVALLAIVRMLS